MAGMQLGAWGRLSFDSHEVVSLADRLTARAQIMSKKGLPRGMARSYGDVCVNPGGLVWLTPGMNRYIALDEEQGILTCEAGALLRDIQRMVIPRGWILPVTPGTQIVTVGGAIANDVHGKNHHVLGSFGDHVRRIRLLRTDGDEIECGPELRPEWFSATVGGLGLTGVMLEVELQLRKVTGPWLATETLPYSNLDEFFAHADGSEAGWEHTVSWVDCMSKGGRGIFMRGNHVACERPAPPNKRSFSVPVVPPVSLVNGMSLRLFNINYFNFKKRVAGRRVDHYEPFFYPLDNLLEWNRMYGPRGFFQYQSVVPRDVGADAVNAMLGEISRSGNGSFLAVLKTFGERRGRGLMSFPMPGVTLALDFPNKGAQTHALFGRLDAIVREARGRLYLAKDARMPRELFELGYPRWREFLQYRDPGISSALSRRLLGV